METGTLQLTRVETAAVETAVAIPSEIFQQAEVMAKTLGLTRNEAYAEALEEWMKRKRDAENHRQGESFYGEAGSLNSSESSLSRPRRKKMTPAEEEEFIRQLNEVYDRVDTSIDPFVMQLQLTALDQEEW